MDTFFILWIVIVIVIFLLALNGELVKRKAVKEEANRQKLWNHEYEQLKKLVADGAEARLVEINSINKIMLFDEHVHELVKNILYNLVNAGCEINAPNLLEETKHRNLKDLKDKIIIKYFEINFTCKGDSKGRITLAKNYNYFAMRDLDFIFSSQPMSNSISTKESSIVRRCKSAWTIYSDGSCIAVYSDNSDGSYSELPPKWLDAIVPAYVESQIIFENPKWINDENTSKRIKIMHEKIFKARRESGRFDEEGIKI